MEDKEKRKVTAYLAHPVLTRKYVREWELEIEKKYNIDLINPFYDVGGPECENIRRLDNGESLKLFFKYEQYLVHRDIATIANSDFLIAVIDGSTSYGTIMEICYAHQLHKPVYLIITNGEENHSWLKFHSTKIYTSFISFEEDLRINKDVNFIGLIWPF